MAKFAVEEHCEELFADEMCERVEEYLQRHPSKEAVDARAKELLKEASISVTFTAPPPP